MTLFSKERPEQSLGFMFWQVTNLWQRKAAEALKPFGLTHVQFILLAGTAWLAQQGETVTQNKLAQHAKTDVMMTSKVCRTLEKKGLLLRAKHRFDTRAKALVLTKSGHQAVQQAIQVMHDMDQAFFVELAKPDQFLRQLNILNGKAPETETL